MDRRTFLTTVAAGTAVVAGCSSLGLFGETSPTDTSSATDRDVATLEPITSTETVTPSAPPDWATILESEDFPRMASVVQLETLPRTYALSPTSYRTRDGAAVRLAFTRTATDQQPARVVASFSNGNPYENTFDLRRRKTPPFGNPSSDRPRAPDKDHSHHAEFGDELVFVPTDRHELVDGAEVTYHEDGTWRSTKTFASRFPERLTLDADETVYGEYVVVGLAQGIGNGRPTGIYEFIRGDRPHLQISVWNTERPGPDETSTFEGLSVPSVADRDSMEWFHDADSTTASYVTPSVEQTAVPDRIEFTFVNHSTEATSCGHWNFYKLHEGRWYHLGPYVHTSDCRVLPAGGVEDWTVDAFHSEGFETDAERFGHLGGGTYAVVAGYGHATKYSGAIVTLEAPPVTIEPTDGVDHERSDTTVTVTSPAWEEKAESRATLTVTATDAADRLLLPEQVMTTQGTLGRITRYRGLRNTLPFFTEFVDEVRLRTSELVAEDVVGYDADSVTVRVATHAQAYRVAIDRGSADEES